MQIVDRGGRPDNAVRYSRGFGTFECYDPTGEPFVPSGFVDEVLPEPQQQAEPPTITSAVNDTDGISVTGSLINFATGNEVVLPPIRWNLFNDMIGREITCDGFLWDDSLQAYSIPNGGIQATEFFKFYPTSPSGTQEHHLVVTLEDRRYSFLTNYEFRIIDGEVMPDDVPIFSADNVEIINNTSIRIWDSSNFYTCLLYTSPSPRDGLLSRMPSSA